jgi:hypothetical protein
VLENVYVLPCYPIRGGRIAVVDALGLSARFVGSGPDFDPVTRMTQKMPAVAARVVPAGSFSHASARWSGATFVVPGASGQYGGQVAAR